MKLEFKTAFTASRVQERNDEPSMTKQSFREETDINILASKYIRKDVEYTPLQIAQQIAAVTQKPLTYGDVSNATNLNDAMNVIADIQDAFDVLPAIIRQRFDNDPLSLVGFLEDPANRAEAVKLGLMEELPNSPAGAPTQTAQEAGAVDNSGATTGAPE